MKQLLTTLCCLLCALAANAQAHWTVDEHAFQYDMTVYFTLYHGDNPSDAVNLDNYEIAAFVDGELRGVGEWLTAGDKKYGYIRVRSNVTTGEKVSFKYYDKTAEKETTIYGDDSKVDFESNGIKGMPSDPFKFDLDHNVLPGDVNGDGKITTFDITRVVDYILNGVEDNFNKDAADMNGDGKITTFDITQIVSIILNQ